MPHPRASLVRPALISGLVVVIIICSAFAIQHSIWKHALTQAANSRQEILERDSMLVTMRLRGRVNDLFMLKSIAEDDIANPPDVGQLNLRNFRVIAENLMQSRGTLDHIHLLDVKGKEIFRSNCVPSTDGSGPIIQNVPANQLQDKSTRGYYKETVSAGNNVAVFSPLDLNVENGKIEIPRKPVIRISGKLCNPDGSLHSILVINYLGDQLFHGFRHTGDIWLLNSDGYWLIGPSQEAEWAFMYPGLEDRRMEKTDPYEWQEISTHNSGCFVDKGKLICFKKIDPLGEPLDYPLLRLSTLGGERLKWTFLTEMSTDQIWQQVESLRWMLWIGTFLGLCILGPASWIGVAALENLSRVREELHQIMQSSPLGISALEAIRNRQGKIYDFRIIAANAACDELMKHDRHSDVGRTLLEISPQNKANGNLEKYAEVVDTGKPYSFEYFHLSGKSDSRWISMKVAKMRDGLVITMADMTDRKRMEDELRRSEALLRTAERISQIGAWSVSFPGQEIQWSPQLYKIHELKEGVGTVEKGISYYAPEYREQLREAFEKCVRDGTPYDLEMEMINANGKRIWVRAIGEADFREGILRQVFGTLQDITEARQAMAHEQELTRKAQMAERAKGEFLAVMSHEIRTPMNGILGFADQLAVRPLASEDRESVQVIQQCGHSLLRILDDILDYSRIEAGRMEIDDVIFSPVELVERTRTLISSASHNDGVSITTEIEAGLPTRVWGDAGRLRQILVNLAGNSLKFTTKGSVCLGLRRAFREPDSGRHRLEFTVHDTGIGISPEKLSHIFEPFSQADSSISRRYGGTGLGLSISQQLATLMNGTLSVTSQPGVGSTFTLGLQFTDASSEKETAATLPPEPLDGNFAQRHPLKILVAEDDSINIKLITLLLHKLGYKFLLATNGRMAVELFQNEHPNCVLMDLHMPEMGGVEATRQIRNYERESIPPRNPAFIAALTADVLPEERARCVRAGMDDYLTKPIKREVFTEMLKTAQLALSRAFLS